MQDSWIIVLEKLYQYRGGPPACGWVGAIVRHEAGHGAARKNREVPLLLDGRNPNLASPDQALHRHQLVRLLLEAIDRLPPTVKSCVSETSMNVQPLRSHTSHTSPRSNVAVRLHRAHTLLRRRLVRRLVSRAGDVPAG